MTGLSATFSDLYSPTGVIWHDMDLIDGVPEVLMYLRSIGKKIVYVT